MSGPGVTKIVDRGGRRIRLYVRKNSGPGKQQRRAMLTAGKRWCRDCEAWLDSTSVDKNGLCRPHANARYRGLYQKNPQKIKARAATRKRAHVRRMAELREMLFDEFEGRCAYCPAPATTLDHLIPLRAGGETRLGNLVPACRRPCNSSKKAIPLDDFLEKRTDIHHRLFEATALAEAL